MLAVNLSGLYRFQKFPFFTIKMERLIKFLQLSHHTGSTTYKKCNLFSFTHLKIYVVNLKIHVVNQQRQKCPFRAAIHCTKCLIKIFIFVQWQVFECNFLQKKLFQHHLYHKVILKRWIEYPLIRRHQKFCRVVIFVLREEKLMMNYINHSTFLRC